VPLGAALQPCLATSSSTVWPSSAPFSMRRIPRSTIEREPFHVGQNGQLRDDTATRPISRHPQQQLPVERAPVGLTSVDRRRWEEWLLLSYRRLPPPARDAS
jgi:hypothetical protein